MFQCAHPCCGHVARTQHGLEVHELLAHPPLIPSRPKAPVCYKRQLTLPVTLRGAGERLCLDRVTRAVHASDGGASVNATAAYERMHAEVQCEDVFPHPPNERDTQILSEASNCELIAASVLRLSERCGDKYCNEFLKVLQSNYEATGEFLKRFTSLKNIREDFVYRAEEDMHRNGFQKKTFVCDDGINFKIYFRDPVSLLRRQIAETPLDGIIIHPAAGDICSHPMNARIGREAVPLATQFIKQCIDRDVCWKVLHSDGEQSFVGGLEIFSDKSHTSEGGLVFYPLHVTLVNFTEEWRRKLITNGATVTAYLPVRFDVVDEGDIEVTHEGVGSSKKVKISRARLLRALHCSVDFALLPLASVALRGFPVCTSDNHRLRVHVLLASYISDLPEAEDMLSVKRGVTTRHPCHRCMIAKESMPHGQCGRSRTLSETKALLYRLESGDGAVAEKLADLSMIPILPVLAKFPMIGIHPCVDIYHIFRLEPMHCMSLGISKMLKECTSEMLRDEFRTTPNMRTSSGNRRSFKQIRRKVLHEVNYFLRLVEESSTGYGLHVDFSKGECGGRLNGLFTESGVMGFLEANDYDAIDAVSPFVGAMVDICSGLEDAPVTKSYTYYVDIVHMLYKHNRKPGWSEEEFRQLQSLIDSFKAVARKTFQSYQASGMGTSKWHFLDHLVEDLRDVGCVERLHGGIYEGSHKRFKREYNRTSKRSEEVMDEVIRRQRESAAVSLATKTGSSRKRQRITHCRLRSVRYDSTVLVRNGIRTTLGELEQVRINIISGTSDSRPSIFVKSKISGLGVFLGDVGMLTLIRQLKQRFNDKNVSVTEANHVPLILPASAYVSGIQTPTLESCALGSCVFVRKDSYRVSHRVVATHRFYNAQRERTDSVMIECSVVDNRFPPDTHCPVWFGKALCFIRICQPPLEEEELCFVQYYEVLDASMLPLDSIDEALGCIRLRWHRNPGDRGVCLPSKEYGLVPVGSIRGRVHVVRADVALPLLHEDVKRKRDVKVVRDEECEWSSHLFYLNRFFRCRGESYDFIEENQDRY